MNIPSIILTNGKGQTYSFSNSGELPLITAQPKSIRNGSQGMASREVAVEIAGFHEGDNLAEVQDKHQELIAFLRCNDCLLYYTDGVRVIYNNVRAYIDAVNSPLEWKQYTGDYNLQLHYLEPYDPNNTTTTLKSSYTSSTGSITLSPTPLIEQTVQPRRNGYRGPRSTLLGSEIGMEVRVTLRGFLFSDASKNVRDKINQLHEAIRADGQLTYGPWIRNVRVVSSSIPENFPEETASYSIEFAYNSNNIHQFECSLSATRVNLHPKIRERPQCGTPIVIQSGQSGQTITYRLRAFSDSIANARSIVAANASVFVFANGIEMPGGTEDRDLSEVSVGSTIIKYYPVPVIPNL